MKAALVISDRDNVATALQNLEVGQRLEFSGVIVAVVQTIPSGHKVAIRPIAAGEAVIKYGSPIGTASANIGAGEHVHTHNVASSRGRGDLDVPVSGPQPRLAEPPDETPVRPSGNTTRVPE